MVFELQKYKQHTDLYNHFLHKNNSVNWVILVEDYNLISGIDDGFFALFSFNIESSSIDIYHS